MHPHVHCHNIYDSPDMDATCVHWMDKRVKKLCIINITQFWKEIFSFVTWVNPEGIMLYEMSAEHDK